MLRALSPTRPLFDDDHEAFRATVRRFIEREVAPEFERWEVAGLVDRELFRKAGDVGILGLSCPEHLGGAGVKDFRFNVVVTEEFYGIGMPGPGTSLILETDMVMPYFLDIADEEQQKRWVPDIVSGDKVIAIAITEPGAGSDVAGISTFAERRGDDYVVNGSKVFITNGTNADLVVTAVRTDRDDRHGGISLLVLERGMPGFTVVGPLDKIGLKSEDTAELFFDNVVVPRENLLGEEGRGFSYLMKNLAQERLSIAVAGVAATRYALETTVAYGAERRAFGKRILDFQNTAFRIAEIATELEIGQAFVDDCVLALNGGALHPARAAMAKWWCTEMQKRTVDACLQLHGGYGYMREYDIARAYLDARVTTIYGGTTEIMKEIVSRAVIEKLVGPGSR